MKNKITFRHLIKKPLFLLLIEIIPVLNLYSTNMDQTNVSAILPSLALTAAFSFLLSVISILLFQKSLNKYIIAFIVSLSFFSYGHMFSFLDARSIAGIIIGRHAVILPVFLLLASVFIILAFRLSQELREFFSIFANISLIAIFLFISINITLFQLAIAPPADQSKKKSESSVNYSISDKPNIYYIIVDGFMREDVLNETYGIKGYHFPEDLIRRGFIIPECTHSNYGYTATSMAASLNMDYLDSLLPSEKKTKPEKVDSRLLYSLLHNNKVVEILKSEGYKFLAFRGFFPGVNFSEADVYFNASVDSLGQDRQSERNFRKMTFWTTLLRPINEYVQAYPEKFLSLPKAVFYIIAPDATVFNSRSSLWYQEHMFTLEKMETIPDLDGNIFAYIHLYTTHQPFVLNSDGSQKWPVSETYDGYVDAVDYTSQRLINIIDIILAKSQQPPIIIIQGDHGYGVTFDRYKILNAYYLPNMGGAIYDTITPVNTFRIILNRYFGQSFELLPDLIHFEAYDGTTYQVIPSTCND